MKTPRANSPTDLARRTGLSVPAVWARMKRGWTVAEILATPPIPLGERNRYRRRQRVLSISGRRGWVTNDADEETQVRRDLLARAKQQDPEALEELRRMRVLTWQRSDCGMIL